MLQDQRLLFILAMTVHLLSLVREPQVDWWERGAATWHYKDDWKSLALTGGRSYQKTFRLEETAASGWIVVWGNRGYRLTAGGRLVGENVDGSLIDDYDLTPFFGRRKNGSDSTHRGSEGVCPGVSSSPVA